MDRYIYRCGYGGENVANENKKERINSDEVSKKCGNPLLEAFIHLFIIVSCQ